MLRLAILIIVAKMAAGFDEELLPHDIDEELQAKYLTMPSRDFIKYFNNQNDSWQMTEHAANYTACVMTDAIEVDDIPLREYDEDVINKLPVNFDSRKQWPDCRSIKEINNQGDCGSCWTFGSANVASDRTCIHKGTQVHLAEQDLECINDRVCRGGSPIEAFKFWRDKGLVTNKCKEYDIEKLQQGRCKEECVNKKMSYQNDKHFASEVYAVKRWPGFNLKAELFKKGPVQAIFEVYEDFLHYKSGIYVHKVGNLIGRHSVRVIGYGVEGKLSYWLVANSWGSSWGENGLFKIKPYQELIKFEKFLYTGLPKN